MFVLVSKSRKAPTQSFMASCDRSYQPQAPRPNLWVPGGNQMRLTTTHLRKMDRERGHPWNQFMTNASSEGQKQFHATEGPNKCHQVMSLDSCWLIMPVPTAVQALVTCCIYCATGWLAAWVLAGSWLAGQLAG